jgi:WhiB family redox-sensing transcriptional regulator
MTPRILLNGVAPDLGADPPEWTLAAVCQSVDPEIFFPEKGGSTREAKLVCARCPVRAECLTYALEHGERFGIYGGLSERERRALERRPRTIRHTAVQPCGTAAAYKRHQRNGEEPCQACRDGHAKAKLVREYGRKKPAA